MWTAYERHGLAAVLEFAAPDAEWVPYSAGGRRFATTEEYRSYIEEMQRREEVVEATLAEVREYGDSVVVSGRLRLRTHDPRMPASMKRQASRTRNATTAAIPSGPPGPSPIRRGPSTPSPGLQRPSTA